MQTTKHKAAARQGVQEAS